MSSFLGNFFFVFFVGSLCLKLYGVGARIWVGDIGARSALGGESLDGHAGWRSSKKVSAFHHPSVLYNNIVFLCLYLCVCVCVCVCVCLFVV